MSEDWHPEDIKGAVRKTGVTMASLARAAGFHPTAAHHCLRSPWPKMQQLIADQIGVPPHEIWPSRYDLHGKPLQGLHALEHNRRPPEAAPHRQNGGSA